MLTGNNSRRTCEAKKSAGQRTGAFTRAHSKARSLPAAAREHRVCDAAARHIEHDFAQGPELVAALIDDVVAFERVGSHPAVLVVLFVRGELIGMLGHLSSSNPGACSSSSFETSRNDARTLFAAHVLRFGTAVDDSLVPAATGSVPALVYVFSRSLVNITPLAGRTRAGGVLASPAPSAVAMASSKLGHQSLFRECAFASHTFAWKSAAIVVP